MLCTIALLVIVQCFLDLLVYGEFGSSLANYFVQNVASTEGWTALMVAARAGHVATVKALLKSNARVGLSDKSGNTALALAEAEGHSNVARVLRGQGQEP